MTVSTYLFGCLAAALFGYLIGSWPRKCKKCKAMDYTFTRMGWKQ